MPKAKPPAPKPPSVPAKTIKAFGSLARPAKKVPSGKTR
jgi:hypothetical protein